MALMSSHIRYSSWWPDCAAPPEGWMPNSAGGSLKMSQPPWASTLANPNTSRKKARVASASSA